MEENSQPTSEGVMAYNKIYLGTPEYNRHQRAIKLRNIGWLILLGAAATMAGSLITLAILMFIGIIG